MLSIKRNKLSKSILLPLAMLLVCASLFACADGYDGEGDVTGGFPEYDGSRIEEYVSAGAYVGLDVAVADGQTRGDAVWSAVSQSFSVKEYPSEQVEYYAEQERAKYRYYARRDGVEYEALISSLDVSEDTIYADARDMVKSDLVFRYIVRDADISLTDSEKESLFGRYAERFSELYGYGEAYISENMREQVYEAMLYDKTLEYLIVNNNFVAE